MARALVLLFCLLTGCAACGPTYIAQTPAPPPFDDCHRHIKDVYGTIVYTPTPFPFSINRKVTVEFAQPQGWSVFDGPIYLVDVEWDAEWVSRLELYVDDVPLAQYEGGEWTTSQGVNVREYVEEVDAHLEITVRVRAAGLKPAGKVNTRAFLYLQACGPRAERLVLN